MIKDQTEVLELEIKTLKIKTVLNLNDYYFSSVEVVLAV